MTQVMPLTKLRRERLLPAHGEVLVRVGDHVEPTEVVAHADVFDEFHILPVSRRLRVPTSKTARYMLIKAGEDVREGQVIAKRRGLSGNTVRAPASGVVSAIGRGRVLLEAKPKPVDLTAYIPGTVVEVVEGYGAVIETTGAIVQGAWGAGGEGLGVLKCMVEDRGETLSAQGVDGSCHGAILIGGADVEPEVFERARMAQVRGIVVGGLSPHLIAAVRALPFPVVVVEGIGHVPMSAPLFRLLKTNDGREAMISGVVKSKWGTVRPEIIIPLPGDIQRQGGLVPPCPPLTSGMKVRILRAPNVGEVGTVVGIPKHARRMETGGRVRGADIALDDTDTTVFVPLANLEILCSSQ